MARGDVSEHDSRGPSSQSNVLRPLLITLGTLGIAWAFLDPNVWPLAWLGLVPLFALAPRAPRPRSAFFDGLWAGAAANGIVCAWLLETIERFGGFPLPVALLFYAVVILYAALPFGVVAGLLRWAGPSAPVLLAPCLWVATEFLFPNLFPWRLAHSQRSLTWLTQIGDVTGPYGLSFVITWLASAAARVQRGPRVLLGPAIAVVALCLYGIWRAAAIEGVVARAPNVEIGIVQGNLSLVDKREGSLFQANVERYRALSSQIEPPPDVLVWPETVVAWGIPQNASSLGPLDPFPHAPAPLIFGAISYRRTSSGADWFNSAFLRDRSGGIAGRYDKLVLMPFGEFIPFSSSLPWLKTLSPNTGDFTAGQGPVVLRVSDVLRVAPLVCYDDLLSGHVRDAAEDASVLLTLANDAWFGDSAALELHESLALWRAIENRRYLVRATNTGLSSVIDPLGRRSLTLAPWTEATAKARIQPLDLATPYQRIGDTFAWLVVAFSLYLLLRFRLRQTLARTQDVPDPAKPSAAAAGAASSSR